MVLVCEKKTIEKSTHKFTKIVNLLKNSCIFAAQLNLNYDDTIRQGIPFVFYK